MCLEWQSLSNGWIPYKLRRGLHHFKRHAHRNASIQQISSFDNAEANGENYLLIVINYWDFSVWGFIFEKCKKLNCVRKCHVMWCVRKNRLISKRVEWTGVPVHFQKCKNSKVLSFRVHSFMLFSFHAFSLIKISLWLQRSWVSQNMQNMKERKDEACVEEIMPLS